MIPVGTLCVVVGEVTFDGRALPSRICTVSRIPGGNCLDDACGHACHCSFQNTTEIGCCPDWSLLRPITPPGNEVPAETRQPETVA